MWLFRLQLYRIQMSQTMGISAKSARSGRRRQDLIVLSAGRAGFNTARQHQGKPRSGRCARTRRATRYRRHSRTQGRHPASNSSARMASNIPQPDLDRHGRHAGAHNSLLATLNPATSVVMRAVLVSYATSVARGGTPVEAPCTAPTLQAAAGDARKGDHAEDQVVMFTRRPTHRRRLHARGAEALTDVLMRPRTCGC